MGYKIVIPAMSRPCLPEMALRTNGYSPQVVIMEDDYHYSRLFNDLWDAHEDFIIVEHDIVPWPGAIESFFGCNQHWCGFQYPQGGAWGGGLGCVRFTGAFTKAFSKFPGIWKNPHWYVLDRDTMETIRKNTEYDYYCVHTPPVAHLKDLDKSP
jgi:hypothetical protein